MGAIFISTLFCIAHLHTFAAFNSNVWHFSVEL